MFQQFLSYSPHLIWPLLSLIFFFVVFLGICFRLILGKRRDESFDRIASLPLQDSEPDTHRGGF